MKRETNELFEPANMDANNSLWELFRAKGTEMKDQDFDHGT